jgi:NitT/TauT family transport system ATP-binding protein
MEQGKKMKISIRNLSFSYDASPVFDKLNADVDCGNLPLVILGSSGSGKTTLLKLLGGLLKPKEGEIIFSGGLTKETEAAPKTAFIFQEPRLLPWMTVLENISLPLEKHFGREEAEARAKHFLSLVSLKEKENSYPKELSGGQAHRVSMARAFAWPSMALFMDEPFQSLDIPLRISLMDLTLSLLNREKRLLVMVTHDPREAVYMGGKIIVLGPPGKGIIFDKDTGLGFDERAYGSVKAGELEQELISALRQHPHKL